jgi:hypothetical protein
MAETKDLHRAYIAGLFDGEGCVSVHKILDKRAKNIDEKIYRYQLKVFVVSTDKKMIDFINSHYKGCISERKIYKENHQDQWAWMLGGKKAIYFLKDIVEYTITKKQQIQLAIEWEDTIVNSRYKMTDGIRVKRLQIYKDIKSLKSPSYQNVVWKNGYTKGA